MKHFFIKISNCNENKFDDVLHELLKREMEIKNFQIMGGSLMSGEIVAYIQCDGVCDTNELDSFFHNYIPVGLRSDLKSYEGTDKYEKMKREYCSPIHIDIIS